MVIFFSFPVFVAIFTWILNGFRLNQYTVISILALLTGLFFLKGSENHLVGFNGIFFGFLSGFFYALYVFGSRDSAKQVDSLLLTLLVCVGNAIIFFIISCYTHSLTLPISSWALFYIPALGVIVTVWPIQLLLIGLKYVNPIKASILSVSEPLATVLVGLIFLNESLTLMQALGIMIVLAAAIFIQFDKATTTAME